MAKTVLLRSGSYNVMGGSAHGSNHSSNSAIKIKPRKRLLPKNVSLSHLVCVTLIYSFLIAYTIVILFGTRYLPSDEAAWCTAARRFKHHKHIVYKTYDNPDYNNHPCFKERTWRLLFMNKMEVDYAQRMLTAVILGAVIGFERKASDRPAGIRTMSLVCLGSCFFTMCSQMAFRSSTMGWDAARVSAAVPSGVGFLGAGLIWKGTVGEKGTPDERHEVHGLTTAASVWLSAAVGVGSGGRLYVVSVYAVVLVILVLRLGPKMYFADDASSIADEDEEEEEDTETDWTTDNDDVSSTDNDMDSPYLHGISREEQRRLLMGEPRKTGGEEEDATGGVHHRFDSASTDHQRNPLIDDPSPSGSSRSFNSMQGYPSAPVLVGMDDVDRQARPDNFALSTRSAATFGRASMYEGRASMYEVPITDHGVITRRRMNRRRSGRNRSHSPVKRFQGPSFHS